MAIIAIDMTPMLPGGENGGAKYVATELIKGLQAISQGNRFFVLTASWNDKELACLDNQNTQRICIIKKDNSKVPRPLPLLKPIEQSVRKIYHYLRINFPDKLRIHGPLRANGVDVLFCPFTALTHAEPGIFAISVVHDLQHKDYPQFFSRGVIDWRDAFMVKVCRRADVIICVSESTRKSVLAHFKVDPDKTRVIHNCIQSRLPKVNSSQVSGDLKKFNLRRHQYMFYPANFWPHKNHRMLITAYGMYLSRHPDSHMDLVFTGAPDEAQRDLHDDVRRMGLDKRIHFLDYLPEEQLTSLWQGCSFLIFPSLYEGFGIPVLEAMQFGRPVLCSNITSLPEVAGDAALYFDPRKPEEITQCMGKITSNKKLYSDLVERGHKRLSYFRPDDMVRKYLMVIEEVASYPRKFHDEIKGIYADGWTGSRIDITCNHEEPGRILEIIMEVPPWVPYTKASIILSYSKGRQKWRISRGQRRNIKVPIVDGQNYFVFAIKPTFIPTKHILTQDNRALGVLCKRCGVISPNGKYKSLLPNK